MSVGLAAAFLVICMVFGENIMAVYTKDEAARGLAVNYLRILAISFLPMAVSSMLTTMLRCMEAAALPLYAGIFALVCNTGLNYLLIFGKWMFPKMGVAGAALATVTATLPLVPQTMPDCSKSSGLQISHRFFPNTVKS